MLFRSTRMEAEAEAFAAAQKSMMAQFESLSQKALSQTSESFLNLANERFKRLQEEGGNDLEKRQKFIQDLVEPIKKQLETLGQATQEMKGTDQSLRESLMTLNKETSRLVGALKDPSSQGKWGEFILEGILEKSGLLSSDPEDPT